MPKLNKCVFRIIRITSICLLMLALILLSFPQSTVFDIYGHGAFAPRTIVYHSVCEQAPDNFNYLYVRPNDFESQLEYLDSNGYITLFADEWQITNAPSVIITFDDGYVDNYTTVFPLLKKYKLKATVFLITDMIGSHNYLNEDQIKEMYESGLVVFQSHSIHHNDLSALSVKELTDDLHLSALRIEKMLGRDVKAVSYPLGIYNETVIDSVGKFYTYAYTTDPPRYTKNFTHFNIPRAYITWDCDLIDFIKIVS